MLENFHMLSTDENVSVRVWHVSQVVCSISSTRIMGRPIAICAPIKIIELTSAEGRSIPIKLPGIWCRSTAVLSNLLHQFTRKRPLLLFHYATRTFLACEPVVDIALDQGFLTNAAPQRKVHGLVLSLAQWNCFGHSDVGAAR